MEDVRKPQDIRERAMDYAVRAAKLFQFLRRQKDDVGLIFGKQFLRSAASVGANLAEAQAGESRSDFVHKNAIAQKEARESRYWLMLMQRAGIVPAKRLDPLLSETEQLIAIITAILVKTKRRN
jgi:four helix bundle protein